MPAKLPKGWAETTLGEVCDGIEIVYPEDTPDVEFTYLDIGSIDNQSNRIVEAKTLLGSEAPSRARQSVRKGDVLFSTVRTYLKKIALIEQDYPNPVASTGFTVIRASEGVSPNFLFWQLLSEDFLQPLHRLQSGSSYPAVRDKDVVAQSIKLAPTPEQERIVAKLETLLSKVNTGETAARRALDRLQRYRTAVLHAAVTGRLTREWRKSHHPEETGKQLLNRILVERRSRWEEAELQRFNAVGKMPKDDDWKKRYRIPRTFRTKGDAKLPPSWAWASIEQVSMRVTVGHVGPMKTEYVKHGIPFLRSQNIRENRFDPSELLYIRRSFHEQLAKSKIFPGDVAVVRSGDVGTTCVIPDSLEEANCADLVLVQRPLINPHLLSFYMNSAARKHVAAGKVGVALTHFNTGSVALLAIALPPKAEQAEIVREVERRLAAADQLASTLKRQLDYAMKTRQSLLLEAFSGRLNTQNPKDEPASELLRRIQTARESEAKKPKAKRMPRPKLKTVDNLEQLEELVQRIGRGATPERILIAAGLGEDVEKFFDLLRAGRNKGSLVVPVGKGTAIKRAQHAS